MSSISTHDWMPVIKIEHPDKQHAIHMAVGDSMSFVLSDVPVNGQVEFQVTLVAEDTLKFNHSVMVIEQNKELTGMEPRISSKGVGKVAKSNKVLDSGEG